MKGAARVAGWLDSTVVDAPTEYSDDSSERTRLWRGFMTARMTLGLVLVSVETALLITGLSHSHLTVALSALYFAGTLACRVLLTPRPLGQSFNRVWLALVGLDILVFSVLQLLQGSGINFTPLFALPILLVSVLGSLRLALGTAAGVTMVLLGNSGWAYWQSGTDATSSFVQAALSGMGYFAITLLGQQLSSRLASEGQRARQSLLAERVQREVNALVIESLADGVLIVDEAGRVRAANPAARQLLGSELALRQPVFELSDEPGWAPLLELTQHSMQSASHQETEVSIRHGNHGSLRLLARTRLAAPPGGERLCVLFLQDQRALEARMRTEKLASMGRLSAAVAHEIRNPLAAITQANALLDEDLHDERLKRLTHMVGQNARRLEKMVEDILNVSRVHSPGDAASAAALDLCEWAERICSEWCQQNALAQRLTLQLPPSPLPVRFDAEHLRRVLVNLLDNALRYASQEVDAIQVIVYRSKRTQQGVLVVWSDGAPMEQSVQRHLFEPFFSSESRSSGLGLYICRQLCESHGASLGYQRTVRNARATIQEGNDFVVHFLPPQT